VLGNSFGGSLRATEELDVRQLAPSPGEGLVEAEQPFRLVADRGREEADARPRHTGQLEQVSLERGGGIEDGAAADREDVAAHSASV